MMWATSASSGRPRVSDSSLSASHGGWPLYRARASSSRIRLNTHESPISAALASAAEIGDSWVFSRIREELARARYNGQPPWDALNELSDTLGLPELADVAHI